MSTLARLLLTRAQAHPDRILFRPAAVGAGSVQTYREVAERVMGLASLLRSSGVGPGDVVSATLDNGPDLALVPFAVSALGATAALADPALTEWELDRRIGRLHPTVHVDQAVLDDIPAVAPPVALADDSRSRVVILFTSGSTGRPRGCELSNDTFLVPARSMVERLELTRDDVLLNVLPLHHMAGLSFLVAGVNAGATVSIAPRFSGTRFWHDVAESKATVFRHLGEMLAVLCSEEPCHVEREHRLRVVYGGGATADVASRFTRRFRVPTVEGYGLTETNTVLSGFLHNSVPGTLGRPLPHLSIRMLDPDGAEVRGPGVGELHIERNPALMLGYAGEAPLGSTDHWYATGDLVERDGSGHLRFVRRLDDVIRRRGENIEPAEIEAAAEQCIGVRRAAAVGVPGGFGGAEICLYVEPDSSVGLCEQELRRQLHGVLAPFKIPRDIVAMDLPRTASEKIDRTLLRRLASEAS